MLGSKLDTQIVGTDGNDVIQGTNGRDIIQALDGDDFVYGNDGNDDIAGGLGGDHLYGGNGDDTFRVTPDFPDAAPGNPRVIDLGDGTTRALDLTGLAGTNDAVDGGAGKDTLILDRGTSAGFVFDAYAYTDTLTNVEHIVGTDGNDIILAPRDYTLAGGTLTIDGGAGNDTIGGGATNDVLRGGAGNDIISGLGGDDCIYDGKGTDLLYGGDGNDTFFLGTDHNNSGFLGPRSIDLGNGTSETFSINGLAGTSGIVEGGAGYDKIVLDADCSSGYVFDELYQPEAMKSIEEIVGTNGNDVILAHQTYDTALLINGGNGNDKIGGGAAGDTLKGGAGCDLISGLGGNDTIDGGKGDDRLYGGDGNDIIIGGDGCDTMTGGAGADTFVFTSVTMSSSGYCGIGGLLGGLLGGGLLGGLLGGLFGGHSSYGSSSGERDTILDFNGAAGDRIDLSAIDANSSARGDQSFSFIGNHAFSGCGGEVRYVNNGGGYTVYADVNGDRQADLTIDVTSTAPLTAHDFIL